MTKDYLNELNEVQREAVTHSNGPVLVIAGAGSGKTRVLTYRIAHLLNNGILPNSILSLTFTNKAASEMKERIGQQVGQDLAKRLWMGTFHSIFSRILRTESQLLGYPSTFTIYDSQDSKNAIRQVIKTMNLDDTVYKPSDVLSRISKAKNNLITPSAYAADARAIATDKVSQKPLIYEIYREYAIRSFKSGVMDFDDLLLNTNILFRDFPEILQKYQNIFQYILVDEYQDTNNAQYLIVKRLSQAHRNICVVGDDAQSIYSFRGAKIENILNFRIDYPDFKLFKLEQNYRSTQTIVNAANSLIDKNINQIRKNVFSENEVGDGIKVFKTTTDNEEGFVVVNSIIDIRMSEHMMFQDFAILYRTNAQSRIFEESFRKRNVPYKVYGGLSFYQRKEIKDLLSYLRLVVNRKDDEAFRRVINFPPRGIGDTTLSKIDEYAQQNNKTMFEVAATIEMIGLGINKGTQAKILAFVRLINKYYLQIQTLEAYDLAYQIAAESNIFKEFEQDKTPENVARAENIEELLNSIREFTSNNEIDNGPMTIEHYLENVSLLTDVDSEGPEDKDKVTLMTIHSAKGLEFKVVFIVGMEEDLFPSRMAVYEQNNIEEERRLFYVALTRAKEKAFLSFVERRFKWGTPTNCLPSRFLSEIDEKYLDLPGKEQFSTNSPKENETPFKRKPKFTDSRESVPSAQPVFKQRNMIKIGQTESSTNSVSVFDADDPQLIECGMTVLHERFGVGKVEAIEGDFPNIKATVNFSNSGGKQLLLKFAKLKIVHS